MDELALKCIYCQTSLRFDLRIKCVRCPGDYTLCLQCFSCGVESGSHRHEHPYQILDESRLAVFGVLPRGWTTGEEERLLEAVDLYSVGNWVDVSNHLKTKSPEECRDHYQTYYIMGNIGKATFKSINSTKKPNDHTSFKKAAAAAAEPPADLTIQEQQDLGYMPLRDDFDKEYDNEAETLISGLAWAQDDEAVDKAFKLQQVQVYRCRVQERERRKRMARDYGVMQSATAAGIKRSLANKKRQSKDEKDSREKLKAIARFQRCLEHESAVVALQREKRLKTRIKELLKFRRNGVKSFAECSEYESERSRREKKKELKKKMGPSTPVKQSRDRESGAEDTGPNTGRSADGVTAAASDFRPFHALPDYELLSKCEKKLCSSIGIKPTMYITLKMCFIRDHVQRRQGTALKVRYPTHLDKAHRRRVLDFLTNSGWIGASR